MADLQLDGRIALVTGAGRGIGAATAARLARAGARVVVNDVDGDAAASVAREIGRRAGVPVLASAADVTDAAAVQAMVDDIAARWGPVDILVNNAGVVRNVAFARMGEDDWDLVYRVNLRGAFLCTRAVVPAMMSRRRGKIVFVSSAAILGSPRGQAHYAAAKAGLVGLTRTLAVELGPHNICVNAVAPGAVASEMTRAVARELGLSFEDYCADVARRVPLRRIGEPGDVADVICFLVSEAARYVTGQVVFVSGGPASC